MNASTSYVLIAILAAVGTLSYSQAFGQLNPACPDCEMDSVRAQAIEAAMEEIPVVVWTDHTTYNHETTIMVQGQVANVKSGIPVTLTVTSPLNNIVTIQQVDVNNDGTYSVSLNTAGSLWKYDGTYTIRVQYGSENVNNKVRVELTGGVTSGSRPTVECTASEISASGQCIPFTISGGTVTSSSINTVDKSIVVRMMTTDEGTITLTPSSSVIRGVFMVLVDGEEWDDIELDGNKITVMFPAGAEEIEIIGTFVIPEFGTIAVMILAVAIVSIIAVSSRSRLSIMPKY